MAGDKTEKPTPRRQKRAREQGQIARSRDLTGSLAFTASIVVLAWGAKRFPGGFHDLLGQVLHEGAMPSMNLAAMLGWSAALLFAATAPILAAAWFSGAVAAISQGGLVFAPAALKPSWSRLNPATRIQQLVSLPSLSRFLRSIIPVAAIVYLANAMLMRDWQQLLSASRLHAGALTALILGRGFELTWKSALVLLAWSGFDYLLERQHLAGELRMSRQELMDDYKETEGNPAVKARIRRLRRQVLRRRMLEDVKRASVVVTNPSQFAIALEYKPAMAAPRVVAKGRNLLAQQIKQVARWHGIPMIENLPLAHTLYRAVEVGQYIPPKLYSAVAAILAAIYRAEKRARSSASGVKHG